MRVMVNGESMECEADTTLASLLRQCQADGDRVATMLNDTVISKDDRPTASLHEEDRVEILAFAGGG